MQNGFYFTRKISNQELDNLLGEDTNPVTPAQQLDTDTDPFGQFDSQTPQSKRKKQFKGEKHMRYYDMEFCDLCGGNHLTENCRDTRRIVCRYCGKDDHLMNQCPLRLNCQFCQRSSTLCDCAQNDEFPVDSFLQHFVQSCYKCGGKHSPLLCNYRSQGGKCFCIAQHANCSHRVSDCSRYFKSLSGLIWNSDQIQQICNEIASVLSERDRKQQQQNPRQKQNFHQVFQQKQNERDQTLIQNQDLNLKSNSLPKKGQLRFQLQHGPQTPPEFKKFADYKQKQYDVPKQPIKKNIKMD